MNKKQEDNLVFYVLIYYNNTRLSNKNCLWTKKILV